MGLLRAPCPPRTCPSCERWQVLASLSPRVSVQIRWQGTQGVVHAWHQEPGLVGLLLPLLVAQAEALPEVTQEVRAGVGLQPGAPGFGEHPLGARFAECPLCAGRGPGSRSRVCPCVSVCRRPCACFVFHGKNKTNTRQTQSAFRHLPEPWKPVIPLDRKGFRLDFMSTSRGCQPPRAGREQSPPQKGVTGDPERTAHLP